MILTAHPRKLDQDKQKKNAKGDGRREYEGLEHSIRRFSTQTLMINPQRGVGREEEKRK